MYSLFLVFYLGQLKLLAEIFLNILIELFLGQVFLSPSKIHSDKDQAIYLF